MMRQLALAALIAAFATPAGAHVTLEKGETAVGNSYKAVFKVPHGCDGSPTKTVRVIVPDGVIGVKPMPKPGWTITTKKGPYSRAFERMHGPPVSEGVTEVEWSGGSLPDDFYDEFVFASAIAKELDGGQTLYFTVTQVCEQGSILWGEVPAPGGDGHAMKYPAVALKLLAAQASGEHQHGAASSQSPLAIKAAWMRAPPGGAKVAAGYLQITNMGREPDTLIGGSFTGIGAVEVHDMTMDGDIMKMRRLDEGLVIAPGATVELAPGGRHLMFMDVTVPPAPGGQLAGTLKFAKAGDVPVSFSVAAPGASGPAPDHSHHKH